MRACCELGVASGAAVLREGMAIRKNRVALGPQQVIAGDAQSSTHAGLNPPAAPTNRKDAC